MDACLAKLAMSRYAGAALPGHHKPHAADHAIKKKSATNSSQFAQTVSNRAQVASIDLFGRQRVGMRRRVARPELLERMA